MKWAELIEETQNYCRLHGNRIFDIWYGKGRQKSIRAYTKNNISKATFRKNRSNAVYYVLVRAIGAGMYKLKEEK